MISSVCPTDGGRVFPRLTLHLQGVRAGTGGCRRPEPGEGVVVQPELADIGGHFVDGEGAGPCCCRCVGARISGQILNVYISLMIVWPKGQI